MSMNDPFMKRLGVICMRRDITPFYRARLKRVCESAKMAAKPKRVLLCADPILSSDDIATELSIYINTTGEADGWEEWDINGGNTGLRYTIKYSQI